ncbi:MAG: DUF4405 domain-containing protein [Kineosporiaceae bacterium]|nr:DUF4405 domain-containing protein [Kineosporiaceae bacterium]
MRVSDVEDREAESGETPRSGREARRKYWVDLALFAAWMVAAVPGATGVPLHEWIALGIIAVLLTHVVMHWTWVVRHLSRLRVRTQNQLSRLVDLAMWTLATSVMLSGLVISEAALPALGIDVQQTTLWMRVHSLSSMLLLVVLAVHVLSHLDWVLAQTRALIRRGR